MTLRLTILLVTSLLWSAPAWADVHIYGGTGCFEPGEVSEQLQRVLDTHPRTSKLQVRIGSQIGKSYVAISMRILSSKGRVLSQREYELLPSDCSSVPELLGIVVEEFIREVPAERWALPPARPHTGSGSTSSSTSSTYEKKYIASLSLGSELESPNLVGEFLVAGKFWNSLPFELGASVWSAWPRSIGEGSVVYTTVSTFLGWEYLRPHWKASVRAKTGLLGIAGRGFTQGRKHLLGWMELETAIGLVGNGWMGIAKIAFSPTSYKLVTLDQENVIDMPAFRALLGIEIPFGGSHG